MKDSSVIMLAIAFLSGLCFGLYFFNGLSRTIRGLLERKGGPAFVWLSYPFRLFVAAAVFGIFAHNGGTAAVLAVLVGFTCVQTVCIVKAKTKSSIGR